MEQNCETPRSATVLSNRACDFLHVYEGARAPSGRKRRNRRNFGRLLETLLCLANSASPWFAASCCSDGSLAVIQPLWLKKTSEFSSLLEKGATADAGAFPTRQCPHHSGKALLRPYGSVHSHLAGDVYASVRVSGQQALARTQGRKSGGENMEFRLPCTSKDVRHNNRRFWTQQHGPCTKRVRSGCIIDPVRAFRTLQEVQQRKR